MAPLIPHRTTLPLLPLLAALVLPWLRATAAPEPPDLLVILADDLGWSDLGCYGSEIETPNLDALAAHGLRFRQFYNGARCCPTRASLLTGLYPHQAGMGGMVDSGDGEPGPYQGFLNERCATIAELLRPAGYRTLHAGKWHVGENRPHWPVDRGFDRFYGLVSGAMNYFDIHKGKSPDVERVFAIDGEPHDPSDEPGFYATDAFTAHALRMLGEPAADRPFFLYLAYTAPHWPLHAPAELIEKYEPRYRDDWQQLRSARHRGLIERGLLPKDTPMSEGEQPDWETLPPERRREMTRKLATHAAMVERMDWNIGRVVERLKETDRLDNTLILFLSDNGASAEEGSFGRNFRPDLGGPIGSVDSYQSFGRSGASVSNTPLRKFKAYTHEGGTRTPLIVHWPAGLPSAGGGTVGQVGHVIDLVPTLLDAAGVDYPEEHAGRPLLPTEGRSLLPALRGGKAEPRSLGWEHFGHAAWREGDLKIVREGAEEPWQLHDLGADPLELRNLAEDRPETVERLAADWKDWAERIGVR